MKRKFKKKPVTIEAIQNGFTHEQISTALVEKSVNKGTFGRLALNNMNPNNPSNKLYFEAQT